MKEDKDLLKKYGKKNPFTVPEGYFQDFSEKLMEQLPEKEVMPEPEIRMWDRIKPWVYMAAMFVGLMFTVRAFVGEQPSSQSTDMEIGNYTEIPDEYLHQVLPFAVAAFHQSFQGRLPTHLLQQGRLILFSLPAEENPPRYKAANSRYTPPAPCLLPDKGLHHWQRP